MSNVERPNEGDYWGSGQTYPDQPEYFTPDPFPPPPPTGAYPQEQAQHPGQYPQQQPQGQYPGYDQPAAPAQDQYPGYAQPAAPAQGQHPGYEQPMGQQPAQGQYPGLPQPPVHPQAQGQHPGYDQLAAPGQGQYPGLPQPPASSSPSPAAPSPLSSAPKSDTGKALGMAIANLWKIQVDVWGGKTERAFERPEEVRAATGVTWVNWVVPVAALVLSTGLMGLAMLWSMLRQIVAAFADFFGEFGVSTGQLISELGVGPGLFFKFLLLAGLAALALGMALYLAAMLASRVGGQPVSFAAAAEGLAVGNTLLWVPYAASIPVFLIFPYDWALMIVVTLGSGVGIMAIVLNFRSVERNGPYQRDPLVAYACFTTLAYVVFTGVLMIGVLTTSELQQSYVW